MNKLNELLNELCPNGVEYKNFGDIALIQRGASPRPISEYITDDENAVNWIKIGDVKEGSKYIVNTKEKITEIGAKKSRYIKKGSLILSNSMSFGRPYILNIDGCIHDGWLSISNFEKFYKTDFLYFLLSSSSIQNEFKKKASFGGAVQNLNAEIVRNIVLPVPPMEVQNEIVHILDDFTLLSAELSAELKARKKQYEYYLESFFLKQSQISDNIKLKDCLESLTTGLNPRTNFKLNVDGADLAYITGKDVFNNTINISEKTAKITQKDVNLINKRAKLQDDVILFASTGTGTVGRMAYIENYTNDWNISETLYVIKTSSKIYPKYLLYALESEFVKGQYRDKISKGSVPHLKMGDLLNVNIPVPEYQKQIKIAEVLNKFDCYCNDIFKGLPAEIDARKKQYEYYRDKLLTFKELKVEN